MTDKITFTSNGESHELPIDGSKTLRPGNVSPDMKLTATGSFNSLSKIVFKPQAFDEPIMTIHPDGKITLGENAQPTEAAAACIEAMSGMIQDMIKNAVSRQPTQSDALREALRFYAREANYRGMTMYMSGKRGKTAIEIDGGQRARAALQEQSK